MMLFSNQETLLTVGFDGEIKRWSRDGEATRWRGELIRKIVKKGYYFSCLSPSEELLAVSVVRGILFIDTATGEVVGEITVKPKSLYSPRFHPDGKKLAAGAADRKIRIWRIDES